MIQIGLPSWNGTSSNKTNDIQLIADNSIDLNCDSVNIQQDMNITRALSVNGNYGNAD